MERRSIARLKSLRKKSTTPALRAPIEAFPKDPKGKGEAASLAKSKDKSASPPPMRLRRKRKLTLAFAQSPKNEGTIF